MGKKRGAPRKTAERSKRALVQIRLSDAEKKAFELAAEQDGKKLSEWIRDRLRRLSREELQSNGHEVPFLVGKLSGNE